MASAGQCEQEWAGQRLPAPSGTPLACPGALQLLPAPCKAARYSGPARLAQPGGQAAGIWLCSAGCPRVTACAGPSEAKRLRQCTVCPREIAAFPLSRQDAHTPGVI